MKAEALQNNFAESMEYIYICLATLNPHLSVSVSAPPDVADVKVVAEGNDDCCPRRDFQVHFGEITTFNRTYDWGDRRRGKRVKHRVSGLEKRTEKARQAAKVVLRKMADP